MEILKRLAVVIHWLLFLTSLPFLFSGASTLVYELPNAIEEEKLVSSVDEILPMLNDTDRAALERWRLTDEDESSDAFDAISPGGHRIIYRELNATDWEAVWSTPRIQNGLIFLGLGILSILAGTAIKYIFTGSKSPFPWSKP